MYQFALYASMHGSANLLGTTPAVPANQHEHKQQNKSLLAVLNCSSIHVLAIP